MDKKIEDFYYANVSPEILKSRDKHINERWGELSSFYLKYSDEVIKYLFYVNAGGTGTIIGFMGASEKARGSTFLLVSLCCFAVGLTSVGILRTILVHKIKALFDNWRKDVDQYYTQKIGYSTLNDRDGVRSESDFWAFFFGYVSGIAFIIGLLLGGWGLYIIK